MKVSTPRTSEVDAQGHDLKTQHSDWAEILGVPISICDMHSAVQRILGLLDTGSAHYVCVADVNSLMIARRDARHRENLLAAGMVTPDGAPIARLARMLGHKALHRVCGPDLMLEVCGRKDERIIRHFFYGGDVGVAHSLSESLKNSFPQVNIVGTYSPPFRPLTRAEENEVLIQIASANADIIWVGLGCPKQEQWMAQMTPRLSSGVMIGVGAAFDFHSGRIGRAPKWMRGSGLEWLHRLCSEPRRLWRRYLVQAPTFILLASGAFLKYVVTKHAVKAARRGLS